MRRESVLNTSFFVLFFVFVFVDDDDFAPRRRTNEEEEDKEKQVVKTPRFDDLLCLTKVPSVVVRPVYHRSISRRCNNKVWKDCCLGKRTNLSTSSRRSHIKVNGERINTPHTHTHTHTRKARDATGRRKVKLMFKKVFHSAPKMKKYC